MSTLHDRYRQLQERLLAAPEYLTLADRDRQACKRFLAMVPGLGTDGAAPALEIRVAYDAALKEARSLVAEGSLTVDLDGGGARSPSGNADGPPAEDPGPGTPERDGPSGTGDGAPEDPLALFHALVARGAKYEEYPIHEAADLFPLIEGEERKVFDDGLEADGLLDPIVVHEGQLIDGRNRLRGCLERGVSPRFAQWKPKDGETVVGYVIKKNLHRRHLSDQQRAMLASNLAEVLAAEGRARRAENVRKTPEILDGALLPHREEGRAAERAAEMVNVSATAVKKAARVRRTGDETLVAAVAAGEVALDAAVQVAEMPKEEQRETVKKGKVKEAAKRVRKEKAARKPKSKPKAKPELKTIEVQKPAANNDNPKPAVVDAAAIEDPADESGNDPPDDDNPLVRAAHDALDELVEAGRAARCLERLDQALKDFAGACRRVADKMLRDSLPPMI